MGYIRATNLNEALAGLQGGTASVIAGGTDWFASLGERGFSGTMIDITRVEGLRGVARTETGWRIGAATTWTDILTADLPAAFDGLKQAARQVGSVQIQNVGTVAGNLCNASPAADGVPPLLTLNASVELCAQSGARILPVTDFLQGVRQTARRPDELLSAILVPDPPAGAGAAFSKLGARKYLVISVAMVAVLASVHDGCLDEIRIAVGSASPVAQRLEALEEALTGLPVGDAAHRVAPDLLSGLSPISDPRASAEYRKDAVAELVRRTIHLAAGED